MQIIRCFLENVNNNKRIESIELDSNCPVIIGRQPMYKIRNEFVSRSQLKVTFDMRKPYIRIETLGANPSTLNGVQMKRCEEYSAADGDIIGMPPENDPTYKVRFVSVD